MDNVHDDAPAPVRREPRKWPGLAQAALPILAFLSGSLLIFAVIRLLPTDGFVDLVKAVIIGLSATIVAYATNRFALERGVELAARGYILAGLVAFGSVLFVGAGLFAATYGGLVIRQVEELRLQEHGDALVRHAGDLGRSNVGAGQAAPVIGAIVTDVRSKHACEVENSCLSGRRDGGRGPVARALGEKLGKAEAIAAEVERGKVAREVAIRRVNDLIGRYHAVLSRPADDLADRRRQLVEIDTLVRQSAGDAEGAAPVALIRAFAEELSSGGSAADNERLRTILRDHGRALAGAIGARRIEAPAFPTFPARAGVTDTLAFVGHFIPVAAVVAIIELIFPVSLLVYRLVGLVWGNYRTEWARSRAGEPPNDDDLPPSATAPISPRLPASEWADRFPPMLGTPRSHRPRPLRPV